jgi:KTSC domain-containing protein
MSVPNLMSALAQGFNAKQILDWLMNNHKKIGKHIRSAKSQGYNDDQILTYLTKGQHASHGERNEMLGGMTEQEKGARIFNQGTDWNKLAKGVGTAATLATGAYGLARGIPALARSGVGQNILSRFGMGARQQQPNIPPSTVTTPTSPQGNISPTNAQPVAQSSNPNIQQSQPTQAAQSPQVQNQPSSTPINKNVSVDIIQQMELENKVKNLASAGNSPEAIAAAINISLKPHQKKFLEEKIKSAQAKPLKETIEDYLSLEGQNISNNKANEKKTSELGDLLHENVEKPSNFPEKGSFVATPDGNVGYIKDIKKTEALIDEDGKIHKLKIKDLKMPDETVVQTVTRLLEMPEIDKSSIINYWSYDPEDKELFLMFHNGETYKYLDVPEELEQELSEAAISPKTKGKNEFGAWSQEDPLSRGATFIQKLIAHPKYKKSGKGEKQNPFYRKLRKGYDYWTALRK